MLESLFLRTSVDKNCAPAETYTMDQNCKPRLLNKPFVNGDMFVLKFLTWNTELATQPCGTNVIDGIDGWSRGDRVSLVSSAFGWQKFWSCT